MALSDEELENVNDNDDDDGNVSLDIDEEAAINTTANISATKPSYSFTMEDEMLEMEIYQNRVSAIRFRGKSIDSI